MLNLSVQHSIMLLNTLKTTPGVSLKTISANTGLSCYFLEQISRKLRVEGIVASKRGAGGGYVLMRKDLRVGELLRIFQKKSLVKTENALNNKIIEQVSKLVVLQ